MNRRSLLKGVFGTMAGVAVAGAVVEKVEARQSNAVSIEREIPVHETARALPGTTVTFTGGSGSGGTGYFRLSHDINPLFGGLGYTSAPVVTVDGLPPFDESHAFGRKIG